MIHLSTFDHQHPYNCNGPGKCSHCDKEHDPQDCVLCADQPCEHLVDYTYSDYETRDRITVCLDCKVHIKRASEREIMLIHKPTDIDGFEHISAKTYTLKAAESGQKM